MKRWKKRVSFGLTVFVIMFWFVILFIQQTGDDLGTDFYPLYHAGQTLRVGGNPYSQQEIEHYQETWHVPFASAGFVYPLPLVLSIWPLTFLPLFWALSIWVLGGVVGAFSCIGLQKNWRLIVLVPFLFMPLNRAIVMKQATLVWFSIAVLLIWLMRSRKFPWLMGWCIAVLPAKPQVGLLFTIAGLIWAWKYNRQVLGWAAGWGVMIWGGAFLLQPGWVFDWLNSLKAYNQLVQPASFLPWSIILIVTTWRLPWYARLAAAQVALFPASDAYSALPLLLTWVGINGPVSLLGSGISWIWVIAHLPNSSAIFWLLILAPVILASAWRWVQTLRSSGMARQSGEPVL